MTNLATWVNSAGLGADILGAVVLFFYGLPEDIRRGGTAVLLLESPNPAEEAKARSYDRRGRTGRLLLVAGFALQLWSNFL